MEVAYKGKAALVIVNWEYEGFENLQYPESDGEMMKEMLERSQFDKDMLKVVTNCEDILNEIDKFIEAQNDKELEMFHFHYSGIIMN